MDIVMPYRPGVQTKTARLDTILRLLEDNRVASQQQLSELLEEAGFATSQGTLSRDLDALGARKVRDDSGESFYSVASKQEDPASGAVQEKLKQMSAELLTGVDSSDNILVLRTTPGAANLLASYIDRSAFPEIVGTIAGDDTIFVLARSPLKGSDLVEMFTP